MKKVIVCATSLFIGSSMSIAAEEQKKVSAAEVKSFLSQLYEKSISTLGNLKDTLVPLAQTGAQKSWSVLKTGATYAYNTASCPVYFLGGTYYGATGKTEANWLHDGNSWQDACANTGDEFGTFATKERSTNALTMFTIFVGGIVAHWGLHNINH